MRAFSPVESELLNVLLTHQCHRIKVLFDLFFISKLAF